MRLGGAVVQFKHSTLDGWMDGGTEGLGASHWEIDSVIKNDAMKEKCNEGWN